ncbi:MAG TPA: hypothetical protein VEZ14_03885 [Dehalococcoidia bacterium]|nr:hypothetical protein [Dehalococcoidia bacterium]
MGSGPTPDHPGFGHHSDTPSPDPNARRCETCGLLAVFRLADREWVPADEQFRRDGTRPSVGTMLYGIGARCAENKRNFVHPGSPSDEYQAEDWRWMLREDQTECDSFVRWVRGLSIRGHKAMLDRQWMIDREDRRDKEMRDREDARDARVDKREGDRDIAVERRHQKEIRWFGGIVAGATVAGAIVTATATLVAASCLSSGNKTVVVQQPVIVATATANPQ